MSPIELEKRPDDLPLEDIQNNDAPQYRLVFGTFTIIAPNPSSGE
jgi:hypothetical protein